MFKWLKCFFAPAAPETEFLPAALEIVETPASPLGRTIAAVIIVSVFFALIWACIGKVDIIATAPGKILSSSRTKIIQPFETGVVRAIHVQDGQMVKAGDVLLEIDSTINESERDRLQNDFMQSSLDAARYKAALHISNPDAGIVAPEGATLDQVASLRQSVARQTEEIRAKLSSLDSQIAQSEGSLAATKSTIQKL